ncbi:MAG TPA: glycerol-3-phosphate 1-O-acyltransferase PlsY [Deltaproteobacteria bacterium]|nr:glycerol-3-phosphate 1-O-acyltransferase PlsY [Deltaproteobacteria bacterium]
MEWEWVLYFFGAYVLGSIPFGQIISRKVASIDITTRGSGNIGATNVARELGMKWGIVTLLLDMLKGLVPVIVSMKHGAEGGSFSFIGPYLVGLCALMGHQFSCFRRFNGGKGVATALGVYLGLSPLSTVLALILFVLIVAKWSFVSLASMVAALSIPILLFTFGASGASIIVSAIMALLICLKHHENIGRLMKGEERKWKDRKITQ